MHSHVLAQTVMPPFLWRTATNSGPILSLLKQKGRFAVDFKETRSRPSASKSILYSPFQILNKTVFRCNLDASKLAQFAMKFKDAQPRDVY